jgi:sulfatase maturation enzyme AslB (radical SAM superfamily)
MTEERKILEMFQTGQITIDEALGLLEALRGVPDKFVSNTDLYSSRTAVQESNKDQGVRREAIVRKLINLCEGHGQLSKIDVHQSGDEDRRLNWQTTVENLIDFFRTSNDKDIDDEIIDIDVANFDDLKKMVHGVEIAECLSSLSQKLSSKKAIRMNITDACVNTSVLIEAQS